MNQPEKTCFPSGASWPWIICSRGKRGDELSRFDTPAASYAFWRAQYTARNSEYQRLDGILTAPFRITAEEAEAMGFETTEAADWAEETLHSRMVTDGDLAEATADWFFSQLCPIAWGRHSGGSTLPDTVRAELVKRRSVAREIEHRFPYTSEIESPLDILQAIHDGFFPPIGENGPSGLSTAFVSRAARLEYSGDERPGAILTVKIDATRDISGSSLFQVGRAN